MGKFRYLEISRIFLTTMTLNTWIKLKLRSCSKESQLYINCSCNLQKPVVRSEIIHLATFSWVDLESPSFLNRTLRNQKKSSFERRASVHHLWVKLVKLFSLIIGQGLWLQTARCFFFTSPEVGAKKTATNLAGAWESCKDIRLQARSQQAATKPASYGFYLMTCNDKLCENYLQNLEE